MKTTVDIDDAVLHAAEDQARKQGKPLGTLIEEALRVSANAAAPTAPATAEFSADDRLEDSDPFFAALEEIRSLGRLPTAHREVRFP